MSENKVCPVMSGTKGTVNCLEEKCAWWIGISDECAICYLAVTEERKI